MTKGSVAPNELRVEANGLSHRVLEWRSTSGRHDRASTVMLVHGFMDAAGTWEEVAPALSARGHRVLAPDMRGFGEAPRAPRGSYYHFVDYVADLAEILGALAPGPVALVGHSMGGTIATLYAGAYPENVVRLANLEGLGPPDNRWEVGPTRVRRWIEDVREAKRRGEPKPFGREDACDRLAASHPAVSPDVLARKLSHLAHQVEDDGFVWRFDPLHRTTSPVPFFAKLFVEFAKAVRCPVLFVSGGTEGFHVVDEEERLAAFERLRRATLEGAGHMLHWTRPTELGELLVDFLHDPT